MNGFRHVTAETDDVGMGAEQVLPLGLGPFGVGVGRRRVLAKPAGIDVGAGVELGQQLLGQTP